MNAFICRIFSGQLRFSQKKFSNFEYRQNIPGHQGSETSVGGGGWGHQLNLICKPIRPVSCHHLSLFCGVPELGTSLIQFLQRIDFLCPVGVEKGLFSGSVEGVGMSFILSSLSNFLVLTACFSSLSIIGVNLCIVDPIISTGFLPKTSAVVTYLLACFLFFQLQLNFIFEFFCLFLFPKEYFQ